MALQSNMVLEMDHLRSKLLSRIYLSYKLFENNFDQNYGTLITF